MFCPNCGKNLPDNAMFCDGCGTRMAAAPAPAPVQPPVQAPVQPQAPVYGQPPMQAPMYAQAPAPAYAPSQPNPMLDNAIGGLKGFFSKNPADAVEKAGKSKSLEWLILFGIVALLNMLYNALAPLHYSGDFDALGLVSGLLETGVWFFGTAMALFLLCKLCFNKDVAIPNIFNMTAVALLPLGCSALLSTILGFVWTSLESVVYSAALIGFALLVYFGIQKLADVQLNVWHVIVLFAVVLLVVAAINALWAEITTPSYSSSYSYSYSDYGDLLDYFG